MGCDTVIDGMVVENDWRFLSCVFDLLIICGPNGELLNKAFQSLFITSKQLKIVKEYLDECLQNHLNIYCNII